MESRWHQDSEVAELILHLKQEDKQDRNGDYDWSLLTKSEERAILKELDRCRKDFVYAARNYFWITNKALQDQLFTLNEAQEIIYQKVLEIKGKGKPQKLIIVKGRQLGCCLAPSTKILTADLTWITIDEAAPGDELVSVDEFPPYDKTRRQRQMRKATVLAKREVFEPAFKLTMDDGETLIATGEHRFLCKRRGGTEAVWKHVNRQVFNKKTASYIEVGDEIRFITKPWGESTFADAWLGGMIDGEGSLRHRKDCGGFECSIVQTHNEAFERAISHVRSEGYSYFVDVDTRQAKTGVTTKLGNKAVFKIRINPLSDLLRLIGKCRPARFIDKPWWEGSNLPHESPSWRKVVSIEPLGKQRMIDLQTSTKTFIANGYVSHNSTLIEAMIAHRVMFFSNIHALIVSYDRSHTGDTLFPIMTTILDKMVWWMKPRCASRKMDEGLRFDNPKHEYRERDPGLDSRVYVKAANSTTGVGAGTKLSAAHLSEFCLWEPSVAQKIIDQEMKYALIESVDTFAILESTGRGANNYTHSLWKSCVERGEKADWYPLFLPAFFEKRRVATPPPNWRLETPEWRLRERVKDEWVRCDHVKCKQYQMRHPTETEDRNETICPICNIGTLHEYSLTDQQCYYMENARKNAEHDDESTKKYKSELAITAQDAFQVDGYQVFGNKAQDFADSCIRKPIAVGDYDSHGNFHGVNNEQVRWVLGPTGKFKGCYQLDCNMDHDPAWNECPLKIWQWPDKTSFYCFGADVAQGLGGKSAYSAAVMIKFDHNGSDPNYQVATWRSNTIDPITYGGKLNSFGRHYNNAIAAVEINKFDSCFTTLRVNLNYPNLYRWKHPDSINQLSNKLGWETNVKSRPRLYMTFRAWLQHELFYVRSENVCNEMRNFVSDAIDDAYASADSGTNDDELMALMIALFCANENLYHEGFGMVTPRNMLNKDSARFTVTCNSCGHTWLEISIDQQKLNPMQCAPEISADGQIQSSDGYRCPVCKGRSIEISRNAQKKTDSEQSNTEADRWLSELHGGNNEAALINPDLDANLWQEPDYDSL